MCICRSWYVGIGRWWLWYWLWFLRNARLTAFQLLCGWMAHVVKRIISCLLLTWKTSVHFPVLYSSWNFPLGWKLILFDLLLLRLYAHFNFLDCFLPTHCFLFLFLSLLHIYLFNGFFSLIWRRISITLRFLKLFALKTQLTRPTN